tara:strand:+ start:293 stop:460 length:168 start_codon:yes stop_codon:yes gene_type:complete
MRSDAKYSNPTLAVAQRPEAESGTMGRCCDAAYQKRTFDALRSIFLEIMRRGPDL